MGLPRSDNPRVPTFDRLGFLCIEGLEIATYLFQVPDDHAQWDRVHEILGAIIREITDSPRRGMSEIARQMRRVSEGIPSVAVTEQLMIGFDRLIALSLSDQRGRS